MKKGRINWTIVSIILALVFSANLFGCGGSGSLEKQSSASLDLVWPENYSFNSSTSQLTYKSGPNMMAAPSYVTSCKVTISGEEMSPVTYDVPLSTGQISGSVTAGIRRFNVTVETNIGLSFTGATTVTLVPGENGAITIQLAVNAPPSVTLGVSNSSPKTGETITLTAAVTDLDADDTHTFTWIGGGGGVSGSGSSVSWSSSRAGTYTVIVAVEDGRGGLATERATITVVQTGIGNNAPVISSVTSSMTVVQTNDVITLDCAATDPDGDAISYYWDDGLGWSATGATASYTVGSASGVSITFTCKASDGKTGGVSTGSVTVSVGGFLLSGVFADANLYNCVISNFPTAVYTTDVTGTLDCKYMGITDISGMEKLTGLTDVYFNYNSIVDPSPLSTLTGLTGLDLGHNAISDVSSLGGLTGLSKLALGWNSLSSTSNVLALSGLVNAEIGLMGNVSLSCSDLDALICGSGNTVVSGVCSPASTGLGAKVDIFNDGTAFIDTPTNGLNCTLGGVLLAGLFADTNLQTCVSSQFPAAVYASDVVGSLACDNLGIVSLSGIENLTGLNSLSLWNNQIADVSLLAGLTNLTILSLGMNQIVNVAPLAGLTGLLDLGLESNLIGGQGVGNVSSLINLTSALITLGSNITMSCAEASALISSLGANVDISGDGTGNLDTPSNGVNCANP